jgi:flavin-binding protein dodecin
LDHPWTTVSRRSQSAAGVGFPLHLTARRIIRMSIARTSEITASSKKGFEDAIENGIKRFSKTIKNVEGAWVKEQKVVVDNGEVSEYRVTLKVTFVLDD